MKIITDPKVYLLGKQVVIESELSRFLSDNESAMWQSDSDVGAEVLCEVGGRLCYQSFAKPRPGGNTAYLTHIKEVGHGSVLEHAVWNLVITGVSRSLTHELVRHRAGWAYSQLSQRYVDESVAEYVVPPDLREEVEAAQLWAKPGVFCPPKGWERYLDEDGGFNQDFHDKVKAGERWLHALKQTHHQYVWLSDYLAKKAEKSRPDLAKTDARKFARQAARSVLPNATETKIFVTLNARAARHFIEQRASRHADPEIRKLAYAVWKVLAEDSPNLFSDYRQEALADGTYELTTDYKKV